MGPPRRVWSGASRSEGPDPLRVCFVGAGTLILPLVAAWAASSLGLSTVARRARARRGSEPCSKSNGSTRGCQLSGRAMLALAAMDTLSPDRRAAWPQNGARLSGGANAKVALPLRWPLGASRRSERKPPAQLLEPAPSKARFEIENGNTSDFDTARIGFRRFSTNG